MADLFFCEKAEECVVWGNLLKSFDVGISPSTALTLKMLILLEGRSCDSVYMGPKRREGLPL